MPWYFFVAVFDGDAARLGILATASGAWNDLRARYATDGEIENYLHDVFPDVEFIVDAGGDGFLPGTLPAWSIETRRVAIDNRSADMRGTLLITPADNAIQCELSVLRDEGSSRFTYRVEHGTIFPETFAQVDRGDAYHAGVVGFHNAVGALAVGWMLLAALFVGLRLARRRRV